MTCTADNMPQEFQVLKCFSCLIFQVHQVKKSLKWKCKICGEKQSVLKVFGQGTGSDCRYHVQKLNLLQGQAETGQDLTFTSCADDDLHHASTDLHTSPTDQLSERNCQKTDFGLLGNSAGRWSKYIHVDDNADNNAETEEHSKNITEYQDPIFTTGGKFLQDGNRTHPDRSSGDKCKLSRYSDSHTDETSQSSKRKKLSQKMYNVEKHLPSKSTENKQVSRKINSEKAVIFQTPFMSKMGSQKVGGAVPPVNAAFKSAKSLGINLDRSGVLGTFERRTGDYTHEHKLLDSQEVRQYPSVALVHSLKTDSSSIFYSEWSDVAASDLNSDNSGVEAPCINRWIFNRHNDAYADRVYQTDPDNKLVVQSKWSRFAQPPSTISTNSYDGDDSADAD